MQHAFRTAADLGITPQEHEALIWVMRALESGEIPAERFSMDYIWDDLPGHCGSVGCVAGWMGYRMNVDPYEFIEDHECGGLEDLFYPSFMSRGYYSNPNQAALAIRNSLVDGDPRWSQVMAGG